MRGAIAWSLALGIIIAAGVVTARQAPPRPVVVATEPDPILTHCQCAAEGEGGTVDPACRATWRTAREHFFGKPVR